MMIAYTYVDDSRQRCLSKNVPHLFALPIAGCRKESSKASYCCFAAYAFSMESAKQFSKKLIKTMVCNPFSFHYYFHMMESAFRHCVATFENAFHKSREAEKSLLFSIDSEGLLM